MAIGSKITELTANTAPVRTDLLALVDDPDGTPLTQKITILNFLKGVFPYRAVSGNGAAATTDFCIAVTTGGSNATITLPAVATTQQGFTLLILKADAGVGEVILDANSTELINDAETKNIAAQFGGVLLINSGALWWGWSLTGV